MGDLINFLLDKMEAKLMLIIPDAFLSMKIGKCGLSFIWNMFLGCNWWEVIICIDNGYVLNRQQAIIQASNDQYLWCLYATLAGMSSGVFVCEYFWTKISHDITGPHCDITYALCAARHTMSRFLFESAVPGNLATCCELLDKISVGR